MKHLQHEIGQCHLVNFLFTQTNCHLFNPNILYNPPTILLSIIKSTNINHKLRDIVSMTKEILTFVLKEANFGIISSLFGPLLVS